MAANFSEAQRNEMAAIIAQAIAIANQAAPQSRPAIEARPPQFRARDIGYFDPTSGPAVEVKDNHNVYHNVFSFTNRLRVKVTSMDATILRQNLDSCLLGTAEHWYTNELTHISRVGLRNDPDGVKEWCDALESRFRDSPSKSLAALEAVRYTMKDARARHDPAEYVSTIVLNAKNAGIAATEAAQVLLAYEHMDGELRRDLPRPKDNSTIADLLEELRHQKDIWFDIYGKGYETRPLTTSSNRNDRGKPQGQQGQYGSNPFRPNFISQRPSGNFPYGGGFGSRPYFGSSNPYGRPFFPYGGTSYQNNNNNQQQQQQQQQPQATQGQQRPLPGNRQPLQITSGNANESPGQNQPRQQNANANSYGGNKNPFRPYGNGFQRRPFARAYQHDAEGQENEPMDEQAEYDVYEDAFYQNAPLPGNQVDDYNDDPKSTDPENFHGDTVESNFVAASLAAKVVKCRKCHEDFSSNNALHRHLRSDQHLSEASLEVKPSTVATAASPAPVSAPVAKSATSEHVILSTSTDSPVQGYAFRGFHYVTAVVQLFLLGLLFDLCFDTGCTMSLIDRKFLRENLPDAEIKKMPTPMTVRGIGNRKHSASEYVKIKMYLPGKNGAIALIERELHIVDDLTAKALIGIDIMKPEGIVLDLKHDIMRIGACQNHEVPITVTTRGSRTNATIYSKKRMNIPPHSNVAVPVTGPSKTRLMLPEDRDLLFEPQTLDTLSAYAHIVDHTLSAVFVRNDTDEPITLPRRQKLGKVSEYDAADCFSVSPENHDLATKAPKRQPNWIRTSLRRLVAGAAAFSAAIAPVQSPASVLETVHPTGVTIHGLPEARASIATAVDAFPTLWKDTGNVVNVPEEEWMDIPLVDNWREVYKPGQARVYPVGQRDKDVIDKEFDKLHEQGRMEWTTTATPFSFPCFVVWKDTPGGESERKGRVVVDIRALNKITMPDAYPVPSQSEILAEVRNAKVISTVDAASFFYQWWVNIAHRHRLTVASHRGQESFKVPVMGYRNSPAYVQRMIDRILRPFRKFCRAYVDDIVIFSSSIEEHAEHLKLVFGALANMNIHLSPRKSFLGYPSVHLLGQKVDALGLATAADKLAAISNLIFSRTLSQLEKYLGLTGYLRQYISHYAAIAKPLQLRKTYLTRTVSVRGNARKKVAARTHLTIPTPKELNVFHHLQKLFSSPTILHHHDEKRVLYVDLDGSKEFGFGAHVYHSTDESSTSIPKQKSQQSILFLSRLLSDAETRYWPTELEIAGIVWVVKKIRHMIEASAHCTIIYTDHSAAVSIVRQTSLNTTSTEKLNLRLIRASEYLQRFRLDVRYKPGKTNIVPDALSRLASREFRPETNESLDALFAVRCFPVSLVEMSPDFRQRLLLGYQEEPRWERVMRMVLDNEALGENAAKLPYRVVDSLLYFDDDEKGLRLCIPSAMEAEVFKLAHDEMGHPGYARTHERLTEGLYIFGMATKLHEFIRHCPHCQLNQTPRHKPYGSLQPIYSPARPFHTLTIDFILALPKSSPDDFDCLMSVTDKFSKAITYIPGKNTWSGKEWAIRLLDRLAELNWGLPRAIISDRDRKFVSEIWKEIFKALKVDLLYSTAWHPQTDGMSERSNQTAEIALRYYIATLEDPRHWPKVLAKMSAALNNSIKYSSTAQAPTQILYGFKTREALDLLRIEDPDSATQAPAPPLRAVSAPAVAAYPITRSATRAAQEAPAQSATRAAQEAPAQETLARREEAPRRMPSPRVVIPTVVPTPRQENPSRQATSQAQETLARREEAPRRMPSPRVVIPTVVPTPRQENPSRQATSQETLAPDTTAEAALPPTIMDEYRPSHIDAKDAIAFASLRMKEYYDAKHQPQFFKVDDLVNLRLHRGYNVPAIKSKKLGPQLVGPFKILERIGRLAYKLELPANMRIHDVISVAHLEPATDPAEDPYRRRRLPAPAVVIEGEEEYEIEKLLRKRSTRRGQGWSTQYLVRWLGYGPEADTWELERELLRHAKEIVEEYEAANSNVALLMGIGR